MQKLYGYTDMLKFLLKVPENPVFFYSRILNPTKKEVDLVFFIYLDKVFFVSEKNILMQLHGKFISKNDDVEIF